MAPSYDTTNRNYAHLALGLVGLFSLLSVSGAAEAATKKNRTSPPSSQSRSNPQPQAPQGAQPQQGGQPSAPPQGGMVPQGGQPQQGGQGNQGGQGGQPQQGGMVPQGGMQPQQGGQRGASQDRPSPNMGGQSPSSANARTAPDRGQSSGASNGTSRTDTRARTPPDRGQSSHAAPANHGAPPQGGTRSYNAQPGQHARPAYQTRDARYAHPAPNYHVRPYPGVGYGPPPRAWYRASYVNWWVHPYYRYQHAATVVVSFGFVVNPWVVTWAPPPRAGWSWVGGYYDPYGFYHPGYWAPSAPPVTYVSAGYVFVPGWWQGATYIEGYYRAPSRAGWLWVDGYYLSDNSYVPGHWEPQSTAPDGYVWEPGFFDGDTWVEGFYRPEHRSGYTWVNGYFDDSGVYNAGYWMPTTQNPGYVWVPGWFDGQQWVEGYWEAESKYYSADVQNWQPEAGVDDGWSQSATASASQGSSKKATVAAPSEASSDDMPLAVPVEVDEEAR